MSENFDVYALFATDADKCLNGTEIELAKGVSITVARAGNDNYLTELLAVSEQKSAELSGLTGEAAEKQDKQNMNEVLAKTILLGFKGMSYKGKPIKYSVANAMKLLALPEFKKLVVRHATNIENFRVAQEEADTKK